MKAFPMSEIRKIFPEELTKIEKEPFEKLAKLARDHYEELMKSYREKKTKDETAKKELPI